MPQWCRQPYGNRVQANRLHCVSTQTYCHFLPYVCTAPAFPRLGKCTGPIATQLQSIRDQAEQPHPWPAPVSPATAIRDPERRERRGFSLSPLLPPLPSPPLPLPSPLPPLRQTRRRPPCLDRARLLGQRQLAGSGRAGRASTGCRTGMGR